MHTRSDARTTNRSGVLLGYGSLLHRRPKPDPGRFRGDGVRLRSSGPERRVRVDFRSDGWPRCPAIPAQTSAMPHGKIGFPTAAGSGLYATYGRLFGPDPTSANYSGHGGGAHVPGVAFQNVNGRTTTRILVTAAIARVRTCPDGVFGCPRRDDWSVATGMERRGYALTCGKRHSRDYSAMIGESAKT